MKPALFLLFIAMSLSTQAFLVPGLHVGIKPMNKASEQISSLTLESCAFASCNKVVASERCTQGDSGNWFCATKEIPLYFRFHLKTKSSNQFPKGRDSFSRAFSGPEQRARPQNFTLRIEGSKLTLEADPKLVL